MTASTFPSGTSGLIGWECSRDKEGYRHYSTQHRVVTTDVNDGPYTVLTASGLPLVGALWNPGNDLDVWAFCTPERSVRKHPSEEFDKGTHWIVTVKWTTKADQERCQNQTIEDPLQEPMKISGSFNRATEEARQDKDGDLILSSSHERIFGIEKDVDRPTVRIEQNVASLGLDVFSQMINTVNDSALWGLPARTIKLSNVSWSRQLWGTCNFYYTRSFDFEVNYNTWDLSDVVDEGYKVLKAGGDKTDPADFNIHKDNRDENTTVPIMLDGNGALNNDPSVPVFIPTVQLYGESNFLTLGIPTIL